MHMDSLCKSCIWLIAHIRFWFHVSISFSFFFLLPAHMNSNCTVQSRGFSVQEAKCTVHRIFTHFVQKKILKTGTTTLSTHLKIILLQSFQFSVFSKISCIRTNPIYLENLTIDYIFFIFLTHMPNFVIIGYYLLYDA